ncbi:transmembrane protein 272-like [Coccinella septempunctata]|uniref:transmembrane protein 272-like n=1 Tax=Coccinella septempunctata TaxID=41139 RepID=UPI001D0710F1|nr:transmembrane protein 272-like [Coccinella septempunctata]
MNGSGQESEAEALGTRRKETKNQDVIRKLKKKLLPGVKYTLLLSMVVYLAMFIIGVLGVKRCPKDENIPLFLCMTGFVGVASKIVTYLRDRIIPYFKIKYMESALYTTEFVFFVLGTYWVFRAYKPSFNPADGSKYCQKTAFMFAFIYLAAYYGILVLIILLLLCTCCCMCMGLGILNKLVDDEVDTLEAQGSVETEAK